MLQKWGHIKSFRFDNGRPFGDPKRETISPCALSLVALGCNVEFNPPRSPTKNAKVERCQGTTGRWADAAGSADLATFGQNLEYALVAQREKLPTRTCNGMTRAQRYPELFENPRAFDAADFDKKRVLGLLAKGRWFRKVSSVGQIEMFGKRYQVGFKHRGKDISVRLTVEDSAPYWCCSDKDSNLVGKLLAENLADASYYDLANLSKN